MLKENIGNNSNFDHNNIIIPVYVSLDHWMHILYNIKLFI